MQVLWTGLRRIPVHHIMIRPELSLFMSASGRLMSLPGLRMELVNREVPMGQFHFVAIPCQKLGKSGLDALAEGAVKVLELHDRTLWRKS